jgi:hypothetical protein
MTLVARILLPATRKTDSCLFSDSDFCVGIIGTVGTGIARRVQFFVFVPSYSLPLSLHFYLIEIIWPALAHRSKYDLCQTPLSLLQAYSLSVYRASRASNEPDSNIHSLELHVPRL